MNEQPVRRRVRAGGTAEAREKALQTAREQDYRDLFSREAADAPKADSSAEGRFAMPYKFDGFSSGELLPGEEAESPNVYRRSRRGESAPVPLPTAYDLNLAGESAAPVGEEERKKPRKNKGRWILPVLLLCVLAAVVYLYLGPKEPSAPAVSTPITPDPTAHPPVASYEAENSPAITAEARAAIGKVASKMNFDSFAVNDSLILASSWNEETDQTEVCLFSADGGKLLCYFDGLPRNAAFLQADGNAYVAQSPYVVRQDGSALIPAARLEGLLGEGAVLCPFYEQVAWAADSARQEWMLLNTEGETLFDLRFSKVFPFTGDWAAAYLKTGNNDENAYLLYILSSEGELKRWKSAPDTSEVALCAGGFAFLQNGEIYLLPDLEKPLDFSGDVTLYPDYDAAVLRGEDGHCTLWIHGREYSSFTYEEIGPVETDLNWQSASVSTDRGTVTVAATAGDTAPIVYSFYLRGADGTEYVSLSAEHRYPLLRAGEFSFLEVLP